MHIVKKFPKVSLFNQKERKKLFVYFLINVSFVFQGTYENEVLCTLYINYRQETLVDEWLLANMPILYYKNV